METPASPTLNFERLFGNTNPVEIEIGCGNGRFLVDRALQNPKINFLGIDRSKKYLSKGKEKGEIKKLSNLHFLLLVADEMFMERFAASSVDVFHIYFPDPWPKRRHNRRRLLSPQLLTKLHEKLKAGGSLQIATDEAHYFKIIKMAVSETISLWPQVRESQNERLFAAEAKTNYEMKYQKEGRPIFYLELKN